VIIIIITTTIFSVLCNNKVDHNPSNAKQNLSNSVMTHTPSVYLLLPKLLATTVAFLRHCCCNTFHQSLLQPFGSMNELLQSNVSSVIV
jgi:hypothetical protein